MIESRTHHIHAASQPMNSFEHIHNSDTRTHTHTPMYRMHTLLRISNDYCHYHKFYSIQRTQYETICKLRLQTNCPTPLTHRPYAWYQIQFHTHTHTHTMIITRGIDQKQYYLRISTSYLLNLQEIYEYSQDSQDISLINSPSIIYSIHFLSAKDRIR